MSIDINKHETDIDILKKQNVNDFTSIKELYKKLNETEEKIRQIKYIDSSLTKKLKKEYENLKKVILNENIQVELNNKIEETKTELNEVSSQMDTITNGTRIIKTNGIDDSDALQNALNEGYNIIIKGDVFTTKKIVLSKPNKSIVQEFGTWYVKHVDDNAIHVLSYNNKIKCNISGIKQPSGNYNISCIVVGQGGSEAAEKGRNCDLSFTQIKNYKGNGIRWLNGARINLFYTEIFECNGHGFFADIGCKDNNDGNFDNLTVVNCNGYGVYLKKYKQEEVGNDVVADSTGSRESGNNTFRNTKCFGNNINFVIETGQNIGTIFSEDKTGEFDLFSGNRNTIKYLGDIESSNNFRNTGENEIEFQDSFYYTNRNNFRTKKITVADTFSGSNVIYQKDTKTFVDTIKDINNEVVIQHEKGSASKRTDEFDTIKIGECSMRLIVQKKIQLEGQNIEPGKYLKIDTGSSLAVPYNAIIKHFVVLNQENSLIVTAFNRRLDSGWYRPFILLYNPTEYNVTLNTSSTIDYTAFY